MHLKSILLFFLLILSPFAASGQSFPSGWEFGINEGIAGDLINQLDWFTNQISKSAKQRNRGQHLDHEHLVYTWKKIGLTIHANHYADAKKSAEVKLIQVSFEPKFLRKRGNYDVDLSVMIGGKPITANNLNQHLIDNGWEVFRASGPSVQGKPLYGAVYVYKTPDLRLSLALDRSNTKAKQLTIAFGQEG